MTPPPTPLGLRFTLKLSGQGQLDERCRVELETFTRSRSSNENGYGYVIVFHADGMTAGVLKSTLPSDAIPGNPLQTVEADLQTLIDILPRSMLIKLRAVLVVEHEQSRIRTVFKLTRKRTLQRRISIEPCAGIVEEPERFHRRLIWFAITLTALAGIAAVFFRPALLNAILK